MRAQRTSTNMTSTDKDLLHSQETPAPDIPQTDEERKNPFFEPFDTPHGTYPFDKIRLEDFEPAFIEGIRRDKEQIDKTINNPSKPTFDNTIICKDDDPVYYGLLD